VTEPWNLPCPACRRGAYHCVTREGREGSRCCPDCDATTVQRPVHQWNPEPLHTFQAQP